MAVGHFRPRYILDDAESVHDPAIDRAHQVVALRGGLFIVPEPALEWLTLQNIPYTLLESLNQDDVIQALRNTFAHPV